MKLLCSLNHNILLLHNIEMYQVTIIIGCINIDIATTHLNVNSNYNTTYNLVHSLRTHSRRPRSRPRDVSETRPCFRNCCSTIRVLFFISFQLVVVNCCQESGRLELILVQCCSLHVIRKSIKRINVNKTTDEKVTVCDNCVIIDDCYHTPSNHNRICVGDGCVVGVMCYSPLEDAGVNCPLPSIPRFGEQVCNSVVGTLENLFSRDEIRLFFK